jgi:Ser/Thr protein kinase RdoA (MazF antagonist)
MDTNQILSLFISEADAYIIKPFGDGLIHQTFVVEKDDLPAYILQHINRHVFKKPDDIAFNLQAMGSFLDERGFGFLVPFPERTLSGDIHAVVDGEYYRLTPFVEGTHSLNECQDASQAFQAAFQFGKYTASFKGFDALQLRPSIPGFHDLAFRWQQFQDALQNGNPQRITHAKEQISVICNNHSIVEKFIKIGQSADFLQRVTHHDTKINNVLFNRQGKSVCVIDLDTTMSGLTISDLGDMFRTYLSPGNEEETDLRKVFVRKDCLQAIIAGYKECMADNMTSSELGAIGYAGEFMIYMQALRFLTDFLNDDKYYGIKYEMNNYDRTVNQLHLLKDYQSVLLAI